MSSDEPAQPPPDDDIDALQGEINRWYEEQSSSSSESDSASHKSPAACLHPVVFGGLCAQCGEDLTQKDYPNPGADDHDPMQAASISMAHEHKELKVSLSQAYNLQTEHDKHLFEHRKLSLIVDLDLTVVHATVDPSVADWMNDKDHLNHDYVQDVKSFFLAEETKWIGPCRYFIKLRPGLPEFLHSLSHDFEMHVYTMGTRDYATEVCKIIDPAGQLFGGRILSRDESGGLLRKRLDRLFPVDTSMVVVIDDRSDVWENRCNLVKVIPFEFFPGSGDINSAFLPKDGPSVPPPPVQKVLDKRIKESESESEKPGESPNTPETRTEGKPSSEQKGLSESESLSESNDQKQAQKDNSMISNTNDEELPRLSKILQELHHRFFDVAADGNEKPDVTNILPAMKLRVLRGCRIVFSSLIPLDVDPQSTEIWKLAVEFGAHVSDNVSEGITHVVARQPGTAKVRKARKISNIKIVTLDWLLVSIASWKLQPEANFHLENGELTDDSTTPTTPMDKDKDEDIGRYFEPGNPISDEDDNDDDGDADDDGEGRFDDEIVDWDSMDKEVDDALLESEDDTGISESEESSNSEALGHNKRSRPTDSAEARKNGRMEKDETEAVSPLVKRQRVARERGKSPLSMSSS